MYHHYLQYVNLANNKLDDLEALGQLPFLMHLNVSNNKLTKVLGFKPPFNLTHVNLSCNLIEVIDDLSEFWSIVYLDLSHNLISKIQNLNKLKYLKHLNLSVNKIKYIENLENMTLETLNLEKNSITGYDSRHSQDLRTLNKIIKVKLNYNSLASLKMFKTVSNIQSIEMKGNLITDLFELTYLRNLQYLTILDLSDNPLTIIDNYWEVALSSLQSILFLDGVYIEPSAKV